MEQKEVSRLYRNLVLSGAFFLLGLYLVLDYFLADLVQSASSFADTETSLHLVLNKLPILITLIVATAMLVMLVFIWRELSLLEGKRKTFESITRQIARGRLGVPEGAPDSSGA